MKLSHRILMILATTLLILPALAGAKEKAKGKAAPWRLATDARSAVQLQAAADYIREENWEIALRLLQHLLDGHPDTLARLLGRAGKAERIVSVHAEAERLLASLPQAGLTAYQLAFGPRIVAYPLLQDQADKVNEQLKQNPGGPVRR